MLASRLLYKAPPSSLSPALRTFGPACLLPACLRRAVTCGARKRDLRSKKDDVGKGGISKPPPPPPPQPLPPPPVISAPLDSLGDNIDSGDDDDDVYGALGPAVTMGKEDRDIESLQRRVMDGTLNLSPDFQRGYVWDDVMASGLIMSVLLPLIVPAIIVHERKEKKHGIVWDIVDGKQRLVTLLTFLTGDNIRFPRAPIKLKLNEGEDEYYDMFNGKAFTDLSRGQQKNYRNFSLTVTVIPSHTPSDIVFKIYEAINTGSVGHTSQQLRKCVFRGNYIELLRDLADQKEDTGRKFAELTRADQDDVKEETDQENILRYFAMRRSSTMKDFTSFKTPIKTFLNKELKSRTNDVNTYFNLPIAERDDMKQEFKNVVQAVHELLGPEPKGFINKTGKLSQAVYDMVMVGTAVVLDHMDGTSQEGCMQRLRKVKAELITAYDKVLDSNELRKATTTKVGLKARRDLFVREFESVIAGGALPLQPASGGVLLRPRLFTKQIKQELWNLGKPCAVCGRKICRIEDAEVDHIQPFSLGGATTLENAQLLHQLCNREKGNRMVDRLDGADRIDA